MNRNVTRNSFFVGLTMVALGPRLVSAEALTAVQAVQVGLKNNYNILIARNDAEKADNTRKQKVGAVLPTAALNGSAQYSNAEYGSSGFSGASGFGAANSEGWTYSAGGNLNWTLFDGFRMFYGLRQVEQRALFSEQASRQAIESTVVRILTAYYNLVSARSLLDAARQQLTLSQRQLKIAKSQNEFGRVSTRELLRGQVLVNADSSAVAARELDEIRALHSLNVVLGRTPDETIEVVADTTVAAPEHDAAFYYEKARKHNAGLKMSEIQKNIAASNLGIARAAFWPVLAASGSYTQSWSDNDYTRTAAGLSVSWPVFAGFRTLTSAQNAKLDKQSAEFSYEQEQKEFQAMVYQQWAVLENAYRQVGFEREAVRLARQSLEVSEEQMRLGGISDVEFRDAQLALINAQVRFESALFQYKVASKQLEQLAGMLEID